MNISTEHYCPDHLRLAPPVFDLKHVTTEDTLKSITKLSSTQLSGIDGVTSNILKSCRMERSPILTDLFNESISEHRFPNIWKVAKIVPIFKDGDSTDPNNYRPFSLLVTVSKLMEHMVHTQCYSYLTDYNSFLVIGSQVSGRGTPQVHVSRTSCITSMVQFNSIQKHLFAQRLQPVRG